jgi:hypothetical protein
MKQIRLIVSSTFLFVLLVGLPLTTDAARSRKSRCTDRCADNYRMKKDACRMIPFKTERKICERRAKEAKKDCKHRCR